MDAKSTILLIESSVQAVDVERRQKLANDFNLIHYDCESTSQFIEELRPGGRFANIVAIIRNGWHKAGKFANHAPFATEIVPISHPLSKSYAVAGMATMQPIFQRSRHVVSGIAIHPTHAPRRSRILHCLWCWTRSAIYPLLSGVREMTGCKVAIWGSQQLTHSESL